MARQKSTYGEQWHSKWPPHARFILIVVFLFSAFSPDCFSQTLDTTSRVVPVANKQLTSADSFVVKQLFFAALKEKTIENFIKASELFQSVVQMDPGNDAALYELANLKKMQNDYAGAQQLLEKAISVNKDNEWYWLALANCYEKDNALGKLENVFNELTRINPDKADYYMDKANAYYLDRKYDEALKIYDQVEQLTGPSDDLLANRQKIYLKQGNVNLAAKQLEQMIQANPSVIKYYLFLAELYNANNFNDKALKVLQTAEKINSNNGLVHLALAEIYRDKKNTDASYDELVSAFSIPELEIDQKIRIVLGYIPQFPDSNARASALGLSKILTIAHPDNARAYSVYADMLMQNDKVSEAKEMYKKSFLLNNHVYQVQEQLVRIELSQNAVDEAIADGETSLTLFPNQAWMNYLVGVAWFQKKDFNKAISFFKKVPSLEVEDKDLLSQSYFSLGDCYHSLRDNKDCDEAYDKSLLYNPDNIYTLNNYAYYLSIRGEQLEKAAQMSKRSNELKPNTASFEDTYAWILFKLKDFEKAKIWIEKALIDEKERSGLKTEHYGDIMFYLGDIDAAVENWKKAKAIGDNSPLLDRKINEKKYIE